MIIFLRLYPLEHVYRCDRNGNYAIVCRYLAIVVALWLHFRQKVKEKYSIACQCLIVTCIYNNVWCNVIVKFDELEHLLLLSTEYHCMKINQQCVWLMLPEKVSSKHIIFRSMGGEEEMHNRYKIKGIIEELVLLLRNKC